ncbi:hypothetical protein D3C75_735590 [compost metagenome]
MKPVQPFPDPGQAAPRRIPQLQHTLRRGGQIIELQGLLVGRCSQACAGYIRRAVDQCDFCMAQGDHMLHQHTGALPAVAQYHIAADARHLPVQKHKRHTMGPQALQMGQGAVSGGSHQHTVHP